MEKYIYAFDLSMKCTGLVIFNINAEPVYVGCLTTNDKDDHGKRLKNIYDWVVELKEKYPAKKVCIERGISRFNTATQVIFRVHGLINFIFYDVEQIYYTPKTVKAAILSGNATKLEVQNEIKKRFPNVEFSNVIMKKKSKGKQKEESKDESDAFAVGLTYFIDKKIIEWKRG
jgi:Holliday junction resolvasome RuvABC endonuclease subunit